MASQVARLFVRGSIFNVTAKNLDQDQIKAVESLMYTAFHDPALATTRWEFCAALGRTIGGEYAHKGKDADAQMAELWVVCWKASVDVLFHNPKPSVVTDAVARKKYFQTYIFNYLRQVLNENKIPVHKEVLPVRGPADVVAKTVVKAIMDRGEHKPYKYALDDQSNFDQCTFYYDFLSLPTDVTEQLCSVRDDLAPFGVAIEITNDYIRITRAEEVPQTVEYRMTDARRIQFVPVPVSDDSEDGKGGFKSHVEYIDQQQNEEVGMDSVTLRDQTDALMERLDDDAKKVFELLHAPPQEFQDRYSPARKKEFFAKNYMIADWLGLSKDRVEEIRETIRMQAEALDIRPGRIRGE